MLLQLLSSVVEMVGRNPKLGRDIIQNVQFSKYFTPPYISHPKIVATFNKQKKRVYIRKINRFAIIKYAYLNVKGNCRYDTL